MVKSFKYLLFVFAAFTTFATTVHAEERGTREEAIAMVEKAVAYFDEHGAEAFFAKVNSQHEDFYYKDLYVFVDDFDGINLAHGAKPHIVGADHGKIKDQTGKYLVQEMIALAKTGETGWVDYKWPDPKTNKIADKTSYIAPLGDKYLVGVGIYVE